MRKIIIKYRDIILLTIGTMLVILSLCLLFYDRFELLKSNVFAEVEKEKYLERNSDVSDDESDEVENIETDDVDENTVNTSGDWKTKIAKEFIGYLEIKKINLNQGLVSKKSYYNKLHYNIQILNESDYPDKENGNVMLASHSGSSYVSFFKNLYKLDKGDEAKIRYKGYVYTYKIVNIYNVPKVGKVKISRNFSKSCLTLITCTHNSKTEQTVYILELTSKVKDGDK